MLKPEPVRGRRSQVSAPKKHGRCTLACHFMQLLMPLYCQFLPCSTTQPTAGNEVVRSGLLPFYVIGNEGGFFPSVVGPVIEVLLGPAERYDIIFDFSSLTAGATHCAMLSVAGLLDSSCTHCTAQDCCGSTK
jgi:FtsP/CotA-like multicopper oxidase with cupredoxin domain